MSKLNILDFGADKSGESLSTAAIQEAVNKCPEGGCVYVPEGVYISGALFLKSDMTLFIDKGAVIKGSDNSDDYPIKTYRWEGEETECYASLINAGIGADGVQNLIIDGDGTIDANGVVLFQKEMSEKKGARGRAVCIRDSLNICISGVTIRQSPAWCVHLINCHNVRIDNVEIHTKYDESGIRYKDIFNGDGIDCDSCRNVRVTNSLISSQDDCIAIKSGKNAEGRAAAMKSEDILIENCRFESGFGVAIGSEMSGGVRNVTVRDCKFHNTFSIGSVKTCRGRGGVIEDILFENTELLNTDTEFSDCKWFRGGIYVDSYYSNDEISKEKQPVSEETPIIRNITFRNAKVDTCGGNAIYISGLPEMHSENITLENIYAVGRYGMKAYFTDGLIMKNVTVCAREGEDYIFEEATRN
jgi:polygalacturonase